MSDRRQVFVRVNGEAVERTVESRLLLSDFLRHELGLTGTHVGCEHGVCGACTVMIDGRSARSCLTLTVQCDDSEVTTIEGISPDDGSLNAVQQAIHEEHGLQCGFCTPGFVMAISEFVAEQDGRTDFTDDEIRAGIAGNLCRCTGYQGLAAAARMALEDAAAKRGHEPAPAKDSEA